jgi:hypothetical protein
MTTRLAGELGAGGERRHGPKPASPSLSARAYWGCMLLATFAVAVVPVLVVSAIQLTGALRSTPAAIGVAAALSLGASVVARACGRDAADHATSFSRT